ncbi:MAG: hypothetical protein WCN98_08935, partial [Verrucomicrobiaceae bacterium]
MSPSPTPILRFLSVWLCLFACGAGVAHAVGDKDAADSKNTPAKVDDAITKKKKTKTDAKDDEKDAKKSAPKKTEESPPKKTATKSGESDEKKKPAKTSDQPTDVTNQKAGRDRETKTKEPEGEFEKPA